MFAFLTTVPDAKWLVFNKDILETSFINLVNQRQPHCSYGKVFNHLLEFIYLLSLPGSIMMTALKLRELGNIQNKELRKQLACSI